MAILAIMVFTWVKMGKHSSTKSKDEETRSIKVSLDLTGGPQKSELNLVIEGAHKLQREEFCR